jgi:hypothetical protein
MQSRIYFHLHDCRISDNPKIELIELFAQLERHILHYQFTHMRPSTQSIIYHIFFSRMVVDYKIRILHKLQPSLFLKVKVWLCEDILQTLMIHIEFTSLSHKVVPPNLESVYHDN